MKIQILQLSILILHKKKHSGIPNGMHCSGQIRSEQFGINLNINLCNFRNIFLQCQDNVFKRCMLSRIFIRTKDQTYLPRSPSEMDISKVTPSPFQSCQGPFFLHPSLRNKLLNNSKHAYQGFRGKQSRDYDIQIRFTKRGGGGAKKVPQIFFFYLAVN